jgi:hypothetical protein
MEDRTSLGHDCGLGARMATSREVLRLVCAEPFRPFRLRLAGGKAIDVREPEVTTVGRDAVTVVIYAEDSGGSEDRRESIALKDIAQILHLDAVAPQDLG